MSINSIAVYFGIVAFLHGKLLPGVVVIVVTDIGRCTIGGSFVGELKSKRSLFDAPRTMSKYTLRPLDIQYSLYLCTILS